MKKTGKEQRTPGKELSLWIARLFPESFSVFGERIAVRNDAGTEATRAMETNDNFDNTTISGHRGHEGNGQSRA